MPMPRAAATTDPLIPHIPFSCSLSFEPPEAGDRRTVAIHAGFTPAWFAREAGLDYREPWHNDPRMRHDSFVRMGRALNRAFPALRLGGEPDRMAGSISQIRTCAIMAALFGMPIEYYPGNWPANRGTTLTDAQADAFEPPAFRSLPVYEDLMRQMDLIERDWGPVEGNLNYQGVLNTAFRLRGEAIFTDMLETPERAHRILDTVCRTMMAFAEDVFARQRRSGARRDYFVTANCVVNMLSGDLYREFVLPYDRRLRAHWPVFGIHNCAWRVDPYAEAYATLENLAYVDFGLQSDLAAMKRLFPHATLAPMVSPVDMAAKPLVELHADLRRIRDELGACRLIVADIEAGTPHERITQFFALAAEVWGISPEELVPAPRRT